MVVEGKWRFKVLSTGFGHAETQAELAPSADDGKHEGSLLRLFPRVEPPSETARRAHAPMSSMAYSGSQPSPIQCHLVAVARENCRRALVRPASLFRRLDHQEIHPPETMHGRIEDGFGNGKAKNE